MENQMTGNGATTGGCPYEAIAEPVILAKARIQIAHDTPAHALVLRAVSSFIIPHSSFIIHHSIDSVAISH
jgi:hypothetical protein